MFDFYNNLFHPIEAASTEEWIFFSLSALLLTLLVWVIISILIAVLFKNFRSRDRIWRAATLRSLAFFDGAVIVTILWTILISYCFYYRTYESWLAFIPYWVAVSSGLLYCMIYLLILRHRVNKVTKKLSVS